MKDLFSRIGLLCITITLFCLASCSSSDDDKESSSSATYSTIDGRTVQFKYCYIIPNIDEGEYDYEFTAFDVDVLYYKQHPEKIKNDMVYSFLTIHIPAESINDVNGTKTFEIEVAYDHNMKRVQIDEDNDDIDESTLPSASTSIWYTNDADHKLNKTDAIFATHSGNSFKILGKNINIFASEMGNDNAGINKNSRKTTCSFAFESNNVYNMTRANVTIITDSEEINFIKKLTKK